MKAELRTHFKNLDFSNIDIDLASLLNNFLEDKEEVKSLGLYSALKGEYPLLSKHLFSRWKIALPFIDGKEMKFSLVEENILDHKVDYDLNPEFRGDEVAPDALIIPALAYDKSGVRLGRGGGFYDRYLSDYTGLTIGISKNFVEELPEEDHDQRVQYVFNLKEIIKVKN